MEPLFYIINQNKNKLFRISINHYSSLRTQFAFQREQLTVDEYRNSSLSNIPFFFYVLPIYRITEWHRGEYSRKYRWPAVNKGV